MGRPAVGGEGPLPEEETEKMPNPKRRTSRTKTRTRRSHDALTRPGTSTCSNCGEPKRPHCVCASCGTYRGREVIKQKEEDL